MKYDLKALSDRQEIVDLIHAYCQGADRRDIERVGSVFHPDSVHKHGGFEGLSRDFVWAVGEFTKLCAETHHLVGIITVTLAGDTATSEAYFTAHHRILAATPAEYPLTAHKAGIDEDWFVGGRYLDRFERRAGIWKIAHREGVHDWERWEPADDRRLL